MQKIFQELSEIKSLLAERANQEKEFLLLKEAAKLLGVTTSCMYKLTSKRKINFTRPGKIIYFKRSDLISFMLKNPKNTIEQIENELKKKR